MNTPQHFVSLAPSAGEEVWVRRGYESWWQSLQAEGSGEQAAGGVVEPLAGQAVFGGRGETRRVVLPDGERAFVRIYRHGGLVGSLLGRWRWTYFEQPPRPWQELRVTEAARSFGIQAPEVLVAGVRWRPVGWVRRLFYSGTLVTREIPARRTLADVLRQTADPELRHRWIRVALGAIRDLHRHGIHHPDLNLTNLLAADHPEAGIAVIDFDRARLGPGPVSRWRRWLAHRRFSRSLAKLGLAAPRFEANPEAQDPVSGWDPHPLVQRALASRDEAPGFHVLKLGPRSRVVQVDGAGPMGEAVVVKIVSAGSLGHRLAARWTGSAAAVQMRAARLLLTAGVGVAKPLAATEALDLDGSAVSVYVSEALLRAEPLRGAYERSDDRQRRRIGRAIGQFVAALHSSGIYVPDLKDENLLVELDDGKLPRLILVDLDRVRRPIFGLSSRRRVKSFVDLERSIGRFVSQGIKLAALAAYRKALPEAFESDKSLAQSIDRARRRKDRKVARRRREAGRDPGPRPPVTAMVICGNEKHRIRGCLESVRWCDEILVVDSYSTDGTYEICKEYATRLLRNPWPGHAQQKQFALEHVRTLWLLNIDADERVSPELRAEIEDVIAHDGAGADGFQIPRLVFYLGRWWRYGGWYPDLRLRLMRRDRTEWGGTNPHDHAIVHGRIARLRHPIWHFTYDDVSDHMSTVNRFTTISADEYRMKGRTASWADLMLRPLVRFLRFYVLKGGVRMGIPGLFAALTAGVYAHLKYAKLDEQLAQVQRDNLANLDPAGDSPAPLP